MSSRLPSRAALNAGAVTALLAAVLTVSSAGATPRSGSDHGQRGCERQLDTAVHDYVDANVDHDYQALRRLIAVDYTIVLPGGTTFAGQEAVDFVEGFFARTDWDQTFTATRTVVDHCSTALVLLDSVYTDGDGAVPLVIGLTWVREHGRWVVLMDQNTVVG